MPCSSGAREAPGKRSAGRFVAIAEAMLQASAAANSSSGSSTRRGMNLAVERDRERHLGATRRIPEQTRRPADERPRQPSRSGDSVGCAGSAALARELRALGRAAARESQLMLSRAGSTRV